MQETQQATLLMPWLRDFHVHFPSWCKCALRTGAAAHPFAAAQSDMIAKTMAARQEIRLAILMGTHERCGQRSVLRKLPRDVLRVILDLCAPLHVQIELD